MTIAPQLSHLDQASRNKLKNQFQNISKSNQNGKESPHLDSSITIDKRTPKSYLRKQSHSNYTKSEKKMPAAQSDAYGMFGKATHTTTSWSPYPLKSQSSYFYTRLPKIKLDQEKSITSTSNNRQKRWTLCQFTTLSVVFLAFFSTAPASCIPLGGGLEFQGLDSIPHRPELSGSARQGRQQSPPEEGIIALESNMGSGLVGESQRNENYVMQPQSQLYLPSILQSPEIGDENLGMFNEMDEKNQDQESELRSRPRHHLQKLQVGIYFFSPYIFLYHAITDI